MRWTGLTRTVCAAECDPTHVADKASRAPSGPCQPSKRRQRYHASLTPYTASSRLRIPLKLQVLPRPWVLSPPPPRIFPNPRPAHRPHSSSTAQRSSHKLHPTLVVSPGLASLAPYAAAVRRSPGVSPHHLAARLPSNPCQDAAGTGTRYPRPWCRQILACNIPSPRQDCTPTPTRSFPHVPPRRLLQ